MLPTPAAPGNGASLHAWTSFVSAFDDIRELLWDDGLPVEDFGILYGLFRQCQRSGVRFSVAFVAAMEQLAREARHTDADGDSDDPQGDLEPEEQTFYSPDPWKAVRNVA
jgi:hypothetical protein